MHPLRTLYGLRALIEHVGEMIKSFRLYKNSSVSFWAPRYLVSSIAAEYLVLLPIL